MTDIREVPEPFHLSNEDIDAFGADGAKWAIAFRKMAVSLGYSDMDEGWLIGWFANAIERAVQVHPDVVRARKGLAAEAGATELRAELSAAVGYMRNAMIDLETGASKATALRTITGGIKRAEAVLASPTQEPA